MRLVASLGWGVVLGTSAVFLHSSYQPFGLLLALLGSAVGVWMIGRAWGKRYLKVLTMVGWFAIVIRASTLGVGSELLVQGNLMGNALVVGGLLSMLISVSLRAD
jgi:hypothetical protein